MSSRRLVQRSRQNEESSPAPRARQQSSNAGARQRAPPGRPQPTPLPPYEPPSCPLSAEARREIDSIRVNHDHSKYGTLVKACRVNLTNTTAEVFDRVVLRNEKAEKQTTKRRRTGKHDKTQEEIEAIAAAKTLETHALEVRAKAEKGVREMVDYEDELAMNDQIIKDVIASIPPVPAPKPQRRQRERNGGIGSDDEDGAAQEDEEVDQIPDIPGVSTLKLLKERREQYHEKYTSIDMRRRYENSDYAGFIRMVHAAQYGDTIAPPHSRLWFTDDGQPADVSAFGKQAADNDESDEDIVVSRASVTLKCPLTLQYFVEPYSNNVCTHSFEKSAILDYIRVNSRMHQEKDAQGKDVGNHKKRVECPQAGCSKFFAQDDFHDDLLLTRQVKRAQQEEARSDDSDDEDDDDPRGGKRARPTQIDSDEIEVDDEAEQRKKHALKVKKERGQSQGMSMPPSQSFNNSMDLDDDDDDDEDDD